MSLTLWVWSRSWGYLTWPPLTWTMWTWRLYCPIYRSWSTGMDQTLSLTGSWHLSQTLIGLIVDICIRTDLNRVSPDVSFKKNWPNEYRPPSFYAISEHILHLLLLLSYLTRDTGYSKSTLEIFLLTVWLSCWMISSHCWMILTWSVWPLTLRSSSEDWPLSRPLGISYQGQVIFHDKNLLNCLF